MSKTTPKKKHRPAAAPQSAPKPTEPADTPLSWAYPFTPEGKSDATDPMTYFRALAKCENGFYPMGVSGMWHGGVHFAQGSAEMLKQDSGVRAIADGKIVAYRLNTQYEETTYPNNLGLAHYSTGFVLVRHELKLPPLPPKPAPKEPAKPAAPASAPAPASSAATPPTPAPADSAPGSKQANDKPLVFFSLYMHTMDWKTYQKALGQAKTDRHPDQSLPSPMSYWEGERYYRVGDKAKDKQSVPKPTAPVQPPATRTDSTDNLPINNTDSNEPLPANSDQDADPPAPETGLNIRDLPKGKVIGVLPKGAEVIAGEGDPAHTDWIKVKALKSGTILPAVVGQPVSPQAPWGYVFKGELDAVVDPQPLDTVVILKEPQRVKAGEIVAHVGQYQWPMKASPIPPQPNYPMLHLEVFAGSDLKDFIDQSRNRAKELNDKNKPLLEIEPGAKLVGEIPAPDQKLTQSGLKLVPIGDAKGSRWVKVQPKSVTNVPAKGKQKAGQKLADVGKPMWVESSLANTISMANVLGWQNFPLDVYQASGPGAGFRDVIRRAELDKLGADNIAIDDKGHHWWNITIGSKDGSDQQGWVCETDHPQVQFRSPWEWPGFELVDNGSVSPADMFKRHIHTTEQYLADEEGTEFMGTAAKINAGELITKLEKAIDRNQDGKVTAQELKHALETPWMAEAVSHLVVRNETEWGGGLGKWEELSPLMQKQTEMWKTELDRLAKLQWWEQIKGVDGFPTDLSPWHLHPIGLIGNFNTSNTLICKHCGNDLTITPRILKAIFPNITDDNASRFSDPLTTAFLKYNINTCNRVSHFFGQSQPECVGFTKFREVLVYTGGEHLWTTYHKALVGSFKKSNPTWTPAQVKEYSITHLLNNDAGLGEVLFGDGAYPGRDYRGRGLLHVTWFSTYMEYKQASGVDVAADPDMMQNDPVVAADSSAWFWSSRHINAPADVNNASGVTKLINPALLAFDQRKATAKRAFEQLNRGSQPCKQEWDSTLTGGNGW